MPAQDFKALYQYNYARSDDQNSAQPARHPVVIVGAGPIGLATAIDLAQRGIAVVLLDDNNRIGEGSRAICFSKRALEVCDTLGVGQRMVDKGATWNIGKVFLEEDEVYKFNLLPEEGHKRPAFINLQQYYVEAYLVDRAHELDLIDIRWRNKVTKIANKTNSSGEESVELEIDTPDGAYQLEADYLIACDGARSHLRDMLNLDFTGQVFQDRFLIVDVKMSAEFPTERWFWFDAPFHPGQSTLLHKQPDGVWRIDFQLGWDADPEEEKKLENVMPRLQAMLGDDVEVEIEWISVYTFQCKRMPHFSKGRVYFAGDAAHQVSPFGARGANSGLEDAQNLSWKLASILKGDAPESLLESYNIEREFAADDNIGHSTRSTDFISPKSPISRMFRNATLKLAKSAPFAQAFVNSGRLSTPTHYHDTDLTTPDVDFDDNSFQSPMQLGAAAIDAPLKDANNNDIWLLDILANQFTVLYFAPQDEQKDLDAELKAQISKDINVLTVGKDVFDTSGLAAKRYDAKPGSLYLFRPDQYLCARARRLDMAALTKAYEKALGRG